MPGACCWHHKRASKPNTSTSQVRMSLPQLTNTNINLVWLCSTITLIIQYPYCRKCFDSGLYCVNTDTKMQHEHLATHNKTTAGAGHRATGSISWVCSWQTLSWDHSAQWYVLCSPALLEHFCISVQVGKTPHEKQSYEFIFSWRRAEGQNKEPNK